MKKEKREVEGEFSLRKEKEKGKTVRDKKIITRLGIAGGIALVMMSGVSWSAEDRAAGREERPLFLPDERGRTFGIAGEETGEWVFGERRDDAEEAIGMREAVRGAYEAAGIGYEPVEEVPAEFRGLSFEECMQRIHGAVEDISLSLLPAEEREARVRARELFTRVMEFIRKAKPGQVDQELQAQLVRFGDGYRLHMGTSCNDLRCLLYALGVDDQDQDRIGRIEECIRELGIDPNNFWVYDPRVGFQFLQFLANELGVRIRAYNARTEIRGIPVILGDRSLAVREIRPVGGEGQPLEEDFPVKEVVIDGNEVGGHWTVLVDPSTREGQTLALAILRQEHRSLGEAAVYLKERSIIDPEEVQRLLSEVDATVAREEQSVRNIEKAKIESFVEYVGIARVPGDVRAAYVALPQNLQQEDEVIMAFTTAIDRLEVGLSEVAAAGIEAPLALEEVDRLRDENQRLQQQLAERDARIAELERQLEDARGSMVSAPAAPVPVQPAEAGIPGEITGQASGEEAPVAPPPPPMDGAPPPSDQPAIKPGAVKQPGDQDNRPSAESIGITPGSLVAVNLKKTTPVASKKVEPTHLDLIKQGGFALRKVPPEEIKTKETRARAEAIANEKTQRELQRIERRIKAIQGILDSSKKSKGILRKTSEEGDKPLAERMKDIARNIPHRPSKFQTYVSGMGLTPPQRQGLEEQVRGLKREAERLRKQLPMLEQNDPRTLSIGEILMRVADIGKAVRSSDDEDEDADGDTESSEEEW